jgi:serine/threonine protein kinase
MVGVQELLILMGILGVVLYLILPSPRFRKVLFVAFLLFLGWVLVRLFYELARQNQHLKVSEATFLTLLFGVLLAVFVWGIHRLLQSASAVARPATCPPAGRLKDFLANRLPPLENGRLTAHLEVCTACQKRVEGLAEGDRSWPGLARKLSDRPPEPEPALKRVMERLKEVAEPEATSDAPRLAGDLPLGFLSPPDKPGQLGRLERYEVLEEVGRGGMGVVLKAFDPSLHRVVAIKVLAPQLATSGVARKRFLREARAAAAVAHDHIVTIYAVDEANGLPYLVMQYVAGRSLQDRLDKEGPLEPAEVLRIGMQTAAGLAAAHAHGIVHRDIKPANILLEEGVPRVKITDFGLARAMDDASLTQSGFVAGSPLYMAPEQARGEALDHRADLFSLGSVLYTLCTGRPPFRAANTLAVLRRVSEDTPRPIRETNPEVPDGLASVVEKLMAKDPTERYPSAAEVVEVLGQELAKLQHADWVPPPRPPAPPAPGLPTSVTICPSCGASLHVPERMVGSVVHCAECGKPFHVEEGSSIQVARAVPPPFGPRHHRRKVPRWVWIAGGCAALLLLFLGTFNVVRKQRAVRVAEEQARIAQTKPPAPPMDPSWWRGALTWFPAEATLFGAIRFQPFGPLALDDERTRTALRLLVPEETARRLTPENLGRIQLHGLGAAYYQESKAEEPRLIVHLEGVALDGRKRIVDFIRQSTAEKAKIEKAAQNEAIRVSLPEWPFAVGLLDDYHAFLARSLKPGADSPQHLKALERLREFDFGGSFQHPGNLNVGYNPPWVKGALGAISTETCGFLIGEIPAGWRQRLSEALQLRVSPRTVALYLSREGQGIAASLTLSVDKAGEDRVLREDLEKGCRQGQERLQARFPALRNEAGSLALIGQTLKTVRWEADRGNVRAEVRISDTTLKALAEVWMRVAQ